MMKKYFSKKSLYKAISWRAISVSLSLSLSYLYLGSFAKATSFTVIYSIISTILYYWHEVAYKWLRRRGKI